MTHDELLAKIDVVPNSDSCWKIAIIRAVVELHKPNKGWCVECSLSVVQIPYPCRTIQALEKELGNVFAVSHREGEN